MAHLEAQLQGRASTFLSAPGPQHPPPPPAAPGPPHGGNRPGECRAQPEVGTGEAEPQRRPPRGSQAAWRTEGAFNHSWPGTRRLRAPPSLCSDPRRHTKHRTPRSVAPPGRFLPSPFPGATATKWRTREKLPATSPSAQCSRSAHARVLAPSCRPGPPRDVTWRGQSGAR